MKNLIHFLGGAVLGACLVLAFSPAHSAEQSECFSLQELKRAYEVVAPNGQQVMIDGADAQAYLDEYNRVGRPTDFKAERLLLVIVPKAPISAESRSSPRTALPSSSATSHCNP